MPEANQISSFAGWQKEKEFLEKEKQAAPALFERKALIDDDEILKSAGIESSVFGKRRLGHVKLFPEDFIVEEVSKDGALHTVEDTPITVSSTGESTGEVKTSWAEVVKMGIDSIVLVNEISSHLGIEKNAVGIAGIKDKHALTSQLISVRGVDLAKLVEVKGENFFLKNIFGGKGALQVGDLSGNRFTIFIRTAAKPEEEEIAEKLKDLQEQDFWNFFYLQRFGSPRYISHKLGLLILQGKFEETVKASLTYSSSGREIPYFRNLRGRLAELWGDWDETLKALEFLPLSYKSEIKMIEYLAERPSDFIGALNQIPEQIKLWVYAYGSYLFNKTLSKFILSGEDVPFELPLALSRDPRASEFYGDFFKRHKIAPPFASLKNFPYVQKPEKNIETLKSFTLYGYKIIDEGLILDFFLEKASYATTFLSHIFMLSSGQPLPEGISINEVDSKLLLGTGTIEPLKIGKFQKLFETRKEMDIFRNAGKE